MNLSSKKHRIEISRTGSIAKDEIKYWTRNHLIDIQWGLVRGDRMAISTPNFHEAANKAAARIEASGTDIERLVREVRMGSPDKIASEQQKQQRRQMLENLYSEKREAQQAFERIIGGNELQDANYLPRGTLVARAVVRVEIINGRGRRLGFGSGFFVGDGVLMTNNHVLKNEELARASEVQMFYERDVLGQDRTPLRFRLDPDRLFYTSEPLDFTIVAVEEVSNGGQATLEEVGWLPLIAELGKVMEGEWLTIIQHPNGERKQVCARDNQFLARSTDVLWYSTDTLGGSSGSPVFTNDWLVVALHHSGVPRKVDGVWKTVNGQDYDPDIHSDADIDWVANEGIRISKIIERLRTDPKIATHPLIAPMLNVGVRDISARLPVMFRGGKLPESLAQIVRSVSAADYMRFDDTATTRPSSRPKSDMMKDTVQVASGKEDNMGRQLIQVTLAVEDGHVEVVDQDASGAGVSEMSSDDLLERRKSEKIYAPVVKEEDWVDGYDPKFLRHKDGPVHLPQVSSRKKMDQKIAPLLRERVYDQPAPSAAVAKKGVLKYDGYSVVMNKERKIAFFSAANVNGGVDFNISGTGNDWLTERRISKEHQLENTFYKGTRFDRGHLTRREDMEWGLDKYEATRRANGTCPWTNVAPQHYLFNQDKHPNDTVRLWLGLEKYILEQSARAHNYRVQVFTGPIFDDGDPEFKDTRIPIRYWKVVVAVGEQDQLYATGYILSQDDVLDMDTITKPRWAKESTQIGSFQAYQTKIEEIEEETSLDFSFGDGGKKLSEIDSYALEERLPAWKRRRHRGGLGAHESMSAYSGGALEKAGRIDSFDDLILG